MIPFNLEHNPIRIVVDEDGNYWFMVKDVAGGLDFTSIT
ncbi:hypothetical protein WSI_03180 [Candidatus Liberibacter asiaticus str. gxpsy]|nr:hypothetical protein WSI_03180 [Candidatus Liberibacter asiaticus str. gxpsy]